MRNEMRDLNTLKIYITPPIPITSNSFHIKEQRNMKNIKFVLSQFDYVRFRLCVLPEPNCNPISVNPLDEFLI